MDTMQLVHKLIKRKKSNNELGMTVADVMTAAVLLITAILFTIGSLGTTFDAQSMTESRNRAIGIAQDRIAKAQLVNFRELGFPQSEIDKPKIAGGLDGLTEYNGETLKAINTETAFEVKPYEEAVVGKHDLKVTTYVTQVRMNTFDGSESPFIQYQDISPTRVTVVVEWDTAEGTHNVIRSLVRYPSPTECAPLHALSNRVNLPEGCNAS